MRCPHHPRNEVIGYCSVCGDLGCEACLTSHEGALYCRRDFRPIAEKLEKRRRAEDPQARPERQRLVVHTQEGQVACGVCLALNIDAEGFHLDLVDRHGGPLGKTVYVLFRELKAVFYVKSYAGEANADQDHSSWRPEGNPLVIEFKDGEVLQGQTLHIHRPEESRFYVVPDDPGTNNLRVLVERRAVKQIYTPEEYQARQEQEIEHFVQEQAKLGVTRNEALGDFYFERRDYLRALEYYRNAQREGVMSSRLPKKVASSKYNIGVRCIKQRDFHGAVEYMKLALQTDPTNVRAKKKLAQLEAHIARKKGPSEQEPDFS